MKRDTCQLSGNTLLDVLVPAGLVTSQTTSDLTQGGAMSLGVSHIPLTALVARNKRKILRAWEKSGTRQAHQTRLPFASLMSVSLSWCWRARILGPTLGPW